MTGSQPAERFGTASPPGPAIATSAQSATPIDSDGSQNALAVPVAVEDTSEGGQGASPEVIRASLLCSIKDGVAWAVMHGAGERYVAPFVILTSGNLYALAAIAGLPNFLGSIVQCFAADFTDRVGERKAIFVWSSTLQALAWLPIVLGVYLAGTPGYWVMLAAFVLMLVLHNACIPAWISLMGDLVPADRRGRYFGLRNTLVGTGIFTSFLLAGWWLTFAEKQPWLAVLGFPSREFGFALLFLLACAMRLLSAWYLSRMYEPPYHRTPADHFTLLDFIRRMPRGHFGRFVLYCATLHVGVGFFGPYLGWYLLDGLGYTPLSFAIVLTTQLMSHFGSQWLWGRVADRIGNKRVLSIGGLAMAAAPLLLLVSSDFWWLIVVQVYDGIASAGYAIAATNYLYDIVTPPKRARCIAYFNLFVWTGILLGNFGGAILAMNIHAPFVFAGVTFTHAFMAVLIGSAILRLAPSLLLLRTFSEYRLTRDRA